MEMIARNIFNGVNHRFEIQKPLPEIGSRIRSVFFMVKDKVNSLIGKGDIFALQEPKFRTEKILILFMIITKIRKKPPKILNTEMTRRSPKFRSC